MTQLTALTFLSIYFDELPPETTPAHNPLLSFLKSARARLEEFDLFFFGKRCSHLPEILAEIGDRGTALRKFVISDNTETPSESKQILSSTSILPVLPVIVYRCANRLLEDSCLVFQSVAATQPPHLALSTNPIFPGPDDKKNQWNATQFLIKANPILHNLVSRVGSFVLRFASQKSNASFRFHPSICPFNPSEACLCRISKPFAISNPIDFF